MIPEYTTNVRMSARQSLWSGTGVSTTNYLDVGDCLCTGVDITRWPNVTTSTVPSTVAGLAQ